MKATMTKESLILTFMTYLDYATLHGLKYLRNMQFKKVQRVIWSLFIITIIIISNYVVFFAWTSFTSDPTITSLKTQKNIDMEYPGIAFCNANKISKIASTRYTAELSKKSGISEEIIRNKILLFGAFFDTSSVDSDEATEFQNTLDKYDSNKSTGPYNMRLQMEMFSPECSDLLVECEINGRIEKCNNIFTKKILSSGFCCVHENRSKTATPTSSIIKVTLNISKSDYLYNNQNSIGTSVQIYNRNSFADSTTGNVKELFVTESQSINIKVSYTNLTAGDGIRTYSPNQRQCFYPDENILEYHENYSFSKCLSKCKSRSVQALCNCIPLFLQDTTLEKNNTLSYCTLAHIPCLHRYKVTWNTYRPKESVSAALEREIEDSLRCPECLPLCINVYYSYQVTSSYLNITDRVNKTFLTKSGTNTCESCSILKIYLSLANNAFCGKDVVLAWYEIMGNFGGLLGICIGCSIISIIEFLFFFIFMKFTVDSELIKNKKNNFKKIFTNLRLKYQIKKLHSIK